MKPQAHLPTVSIGARDWRVAMIALVSLVGASAFVLGIESGALLNNPLLDRLRTSSNAPLHATIAHHVSLDLHLLNNPNIPARRFSVAHPLPALVASPQRFSIAADAQARFEVFGEAALVSVSADENTVRQLNPHSDRLMLMLMLLRLHPHRS
jgi:hypothetical protein